MKLCAACHEDLPKDKFSKKQWKLGAQSQRRCTSCVRDNREVVHPPSANNEADNNDTGIVSLLDSMSINDNKVPVSDEELFKQPPLQYEDCPICFLRMPSFWTGYKYMSCCGMMICSGCIYGNSKLHKDDLCPFCRTPSPTTKEEVVKRTVKRAELDDPEAIYNLGSFHYQGKYDCPQNSNKALELWHRAGELGNAGSYYSMGSVYNHGRGVVRDEKKAIHYWKLAAMGGDAMARFNLGATEQNKGNVGRAMKHYMIAASGGYSDCLPKIKRLFIQGYVAKDDYAKALRAHQSYLDEVRSNQRDEAATEGEDYKYYEE